MNIQQLEYILAVDTYRHFAKAAEHCRVTQPTLSMMIQKLEDELGVKLFDRNIQPVCPTPAGRKVIDQARVVLYQTSLIKDIVNEEEQSLKGTFRLAVLPTIAPYLLPRFFQQVSEKHPDLDIRILEMQTAPYNESPPERRDRRRHHREPTDGDAATGRYPILRTVLCLCSPQRKRVQERDGPFCRYQRRTSLVAG